MKDRDAKKMIEMLIRHQNNKIKQLQEELKDQVNIINGKDLEINDLKSKLSKQTNWIARGEYCTCKFPHNKDIELNKLENELSLYKNAFRFKLKVSTDFDGYTVMYELGDTKLLDKLIGKSVIALIVENGND